MTELFGPATSIAVHRLRAVLAQARAECALHLDDCAATDHDPGARLQDGKLKLTDARGAMEYLVERHGWQDAFSDRVDVRARERAAITAFDAVVMPAFFTSLRAEPIDAVTRKAVLGELRELAQTAHATGYRADNALALWIAPAWMRMRWLREASPLAAMLGEWLELGGWLEAAAGQPSVHKTAPSRSKVLAEIAAVRPA